MKSKFKVAEIAALTGEKIQVVYRLLSPEVKQRTQAKYVKKLTQEDKNEVIRIYNDDEVSYSLPDMKYSGLWFMHFTLREAYAVYVRKCQHKRIVAEKTFERLKPRNIQTVQKTQDVTSRFKNGTSDEVTSCFKNGTSDEVTSHFKNDEVTSRLKNVTCEVTSRLKKVQHDLPKKKCVQRRCPMCGVTKYERDLIQKNRF